MYFLLIFVIIIVIAAYILSILDRKDKINRLNEWLDRQDFEIEKMINFLLDIEKETLFNSFKSHIISQVASDKYAKSPPCGLDYLLYRKLTNQFFNEKLDKIKNIKFNKNEL